MDRTGSETSPQSCHKQTESLYNVDGNEPPQNAVQGRMSHAEQDLFIYRLLHEPRKEISTEDKPTEDNAQEDTPGEDEIAKNTRRREQNRMASQRSRQRMKHRMTELEQALNRGRYALQNYRGENLRMRAENAILETEATWYRIHNPNLAPPYQYPFHQVVDNSICPQPTTMANYTPGFAPGTTNRIPF